MIYVIVEFLLGKLADVVLLDQMGLVSVFYFLNDLVLLWGYL